MKPLACTCRTNSSGGAQPRSRTHCSHAGSHPASVPQQGQLRCSGAIQTGPWSVRGSLPCAGAPCQPVFRAPRG